MDGQCLSCRDLTLITTSFEHISLGFPKTVWKSDKNMLSWESSDLVFLFSSRNRKQKTNKNIYLNISGLSHNFILLFEKKNSTSDNMFSISILTACQPLPSALIVSGDLDRLAMSMAVLPPHNRAHSHLFVVMCWTVMSFATAGDTSCVPPAAG